ncbi:MAG: hypothetical protein SGBAC_013475, partial [Bacillariaceae sp.]
INNCNTDNPVDVRPYDILCGRSKTCFNNIGNRRFRITIGMNVKKYDALPSRTERGNFIYDLAETLKEDAGFRFIRISKKNGRVELTGEEVRAKIGHALRDLSKAQAEANAAVAKPTEEAKKFLQSSSKQQPRSLQATHIVTPQLPQRKVTTDVADIRQEMMMMVDSSVPATTTAAATATPTPDHQHHQEKMSHQKSSSTKRSLILEDDEISDMTQEAINLPQNEMLPDHEEEAELQSMKMPALIFPTTTEESQKAKEVGDDEYILMSLQFDDDEMLNHRLEPASKSTFDLDHEHGDEDEGSVEDVPYTEFLRRCSLH